MRSMPLQASSDLLKPVIDRRAKAASYQRRRREAAAGVYRAPSVVEAGRLVTHNYFEYFTIKVVNFLHKIA